MDWWWLAWKWSQRLSCRFGRHRPPTRSCEVSNNYHRSSSSLITTIPSLKLPLIVRQSSIFKISELFSHQLDFHQQFLSPAVYIPESSHYHPTSRRHRLENRKNCAAPLCRIPVFASNFPSAATFCATLNLVQAPNEAPPSSLLPFSRVIFRKLLRTH